MKLTREEHSDLKLVTSYDATHVAINRQRYTQSLIVLPSSVHAPWSAQDFASLSSSDWSAVLALQPALILLGTGARQRFPAAALLRPLIEARIGFEVMDTGSACRTYNILASEGRVVAAALLLG